MNKELADLLFPNIIKKREYYLKKYPRRNLKDKAIVTRFAPSPTGFVHMGSLYTAFLASQMAKQTNGVFYLRIEDTDQKREVKDGITGIINDLDSFDFDIAEGPVQGGEYGPYIQSERKEIYQCFVKELVENGYAYPCFCTEEELAELRHSQELAKERIGYYGKYAISRNLTFEEIKDKVESGLPYVIRLKSPGNFNKTFSFNDCIKGNITFPENDLDIVLLKNDGIPTYHFAHIIDDYLMGTTLVLRGDEWLSSIPIHLQLFEVLGLKPPKYAHIAPLTKKEESSVRKLSKRKDPEASIHFYQEKGIPATVIKLFLATLANANFETWYNQNKDKTIDDFKFELKRMPVGGTYFDLEKLNSVSRIYFSTLKANELYEQSLNYYQKYDQDFYNLISNQKEKTIKLLNIEREIKRPRKDLTCYQDVKKEFENFYDEIFLNKPEIEAYSSLEGEKSYDISLLSQYIDIYREDDSEEEWMNRLRDLAIKNGYASEVKQFKENPTKYKGHIGDICETIRVAVTGKRKSPNLYDILKILGHKSIEDRFEHFKNYLLK